jgi:hypothetical protein
VLVGNHLAICSTSTLTAMPTVTFAVLALLPLLTWYLYAQAKAWRFKKFRHIPQQFPSSLVLGHLGLIAGGYKEVGGSKHHVGTLVHHLNILIPAELRL